MATRSKKPKSPKAAQSRDGQPAQSPQAPQPVPTIRKGIYLSTLIYLEGNQAAPDDFTALATSALKNALSSALTGDHDGLSMTLKKIEVQNDVEQDDGAGSSKSRGGKGEKFQF